MLTRAAKILRHLVALLSRSSRVGATFRVSEEGWTVVVKGS